jgi:hypothetical protein
MANKYLAIYLNDHLAGATGGLELVKRARGSNQGTQLGETLLALQAEIAEDRETLRQLMSKLGVREDPVKKAAGWVAEKVGRLKLNGEITSYSPLSRLVELEGLLLGVSGKQSMWKALEASHGERLAGFDLDALAKRAESQKRRLSAARSRVAADTLASA